jgi:ribonuclease VapC
MVIDAPGLVAILLDEPDAPPIRVTVEADPVRLISAATLLETAIVIEARFGEPGGRELDLVLHRARIEVVSVDAEQVEVARHAFRTYGKVPHADLPLVPA